MAEERWLIERSATFLYLALNSIADVDRQANKPPSNSLPGLLAEGVSAETHPQRKTVAGMPNLIDCGDTLLARRSSFANISISHETEDPVMKLVAQVPYSYRGDKSVPSFDDSGPVVFMDGNCVLCTLGARAIARFDRAVEFRICPIETSLGESVLRHYGLNPQDPDSWLYLVDGQAYTSLDAMIRAGRRMGGWGLVLAPLAILPRRVQDWVYARLARNRYHLFGRTKMCAIPDAKLQQRLLT